MPGVIDFQRIPKPQCSLDGQHRLLQQATKTYLESRNARVKAKAKATIQALQDKPVGE